MLYQIANIYKVNIDWILGLSNYKKVLTSSNKINIKIVRNSLRNLRKCMNLTQKDLSKFLNGSISAYTLYE